MKKRQCRLATVVALCSLVPATAATGGMITFEDLGLAPGAILQSASGTGLNTGGYTWGPALATPGLDFVLAANQVVNYPYNGTTVGIVQNEGVLSQQGGGAFSLSQFDWAGWADPLVERDFTVRGVRADASELLQVFSPDGISDGFGGAADFQTFVLGVDWTNLVSVTWQHNTLPGDPNGFFAVDNMQVEAVPEPGSFVLFGSGLLLGLWWKRRRSLPEWRKLAIQER